MSILVNTVNEQEEKVLIAFLDSLAIQYKTDIEDSQLMKHFVKVYNEELDKSNAEIEAGNFVSQEDVDLLFENRRKAVK